MVYSPREDSFLLEIEVKKLAKGKTFLDMGSGSGFQSKSALKAGAKSVLAADVDDESVKELKNQGIRAIKSNLFSNVNGKFDLIAFNPPYLPEDPRECKESKLATTGGKKGDEIIIKFLKGAKNHLSKNGIILLVVSSLTPRKEILTLIKKQKMNKKILSSEKFFFEELEVWKLTKT